MTTYERIDLSRGAHAAHHRAIFISDVHLGTRTSQARGLLDFLRWHEADTIYLVGDIVDFWRVRRGAYWPQQHNDVLQKLLRRVRKGTRVVFIPGNHDEGVRDFCGMQFGGIEIHQNIVHETAAGKRFIVMHGDEFDVVVRNSRWLAYFGDWAYSAALVLNAVLNRLRRRIGMNYWSLSAWLKRKVKNAVNYIGAFEEALAGEARRIGADGVVCGHIHHARIADLPGLRYINTGDWVESCTAIAEHHDGRLELIAWTALDREEPGLVAVGDEHALGEAAE